MLALACKARSCGEGGSLRFGFWFQKPDVIIISRTVVKKRINVTIWLVSLKVSVQVLLPNQIYFR